MSNSKCDNKYIVTQGTQTLVQVCFGWVVLSSLSIPLGLLHPRQYRFCKAEFMKERRKDQPFFEIATH